MVYLPREMVQRIASHLGPRNRARLATVDRTSRLAVADDARRRRPGIARRWRAPVDDMAKLRRDAIYLTIRGVRFAGSIMSLRVRRGTTKAVAQRGRLKLLFKRAPQGQPNILFLELGSRSVPIWYDGTDAMLDFSLEIAAMLLDQHSHDVLRPVVRGVADGLRIVRR